MKHVVLEIQGKYAVLLSDTGDVVRVKNRNYAVGQRVEGHIKKRTTDFVKWVASAVTTLVLIIGAGIYAYLTPNVELSLDVNPSIEISTNIFNIIIDAKAMNHDGEKLLNQVQLKGKSMQSGLSALISALIEGRYLTPDEASTMMVTTYSHNAVRSFAILEEMIQTMRAETANHQIKTNFRGESVDGNMRARAQGYGVTPGKLLLAERYVKTLKNPTSQDLEDSLNKSVDELVSETNLLALPDINLEGGDRTALLSGYPIDVLPLYKCQKVQSCSFTLSEWENDAMYGVDEYMLTYTTDTFREDVLTYYNKLLTSREKATETSLLGNIGKYKVNVFADARPDGKVRVILSVDLNADSNPYFANYPDTVRALGGDKNVVVSRSYSQTLIDTLKVSYTIDYRTELTVDEFETLYQNEYGGKEGFQKVSTENDSQVRYSFIEGDNIWEMAIDKDHGEYAIPMLTISCRTK